jgi:hypothetical protein
MAVQSQQEPLVIEGFIDILQLCISVALLCLDDTDFPRHGTNLTSPRVPIFLSLSKSPVHISRVVNELHLG